MSGSGTGPGGGGNYSKYADDDDDGAPKAKRGKDGILRSANRRYEFECPECDADNPVDDGFADQEEVRCNYCGLEFKAHFIDDKLKLKAT